MFKLIISDLDGTLVDSNKNISPFTKEVIKEIQNRGVEFIIATGRGYKGALKAMCDLDLKCDIICNNGATIYNSKGELIFQKIIDHTCALKIFKSIDTNSIFLGSYEDQIYISKGKLKESQDFLHNIPQKIIEISLENFNDFKFEKIVILNKNNNSLKKIQENLSKYPCINSFISQDYFLDIVHHETSKGIALKYIADLKNVDLQHTLAFGDAFNDYDMLKFAGKGVVMANGFQELKNIFETHNLTNDDNGVAHYISNLFQLKISLD